MAGISDTEHVYATISLGDPIVHETEPFTDSEDQIASVNAEIVLPIVISRVAPAMSGSIGG